jgi:hypothetical protein
MNDELTNAKNRARALRRKANLALAESEALLADRLKELVTHLKTGDPSDQQLELLPLLVDSLGKLRDQAMAASWSIKLADAIKKNARLLDATRNTPTLHKLSSWAGRVQKATKGDGREQAEKNKRKADDLLEGLGD